MMEVGDTVKHKGSGDLGKVVHSTFGVSVKSIDPDRHWKTLGMPVENVSGFWEVVESE